MIASRGTKFFYSLTNFIRNKPNLGYVFCARISVHGRMTTRLLTCIKLERRFHSDNLMLKFERYIFEPYFCFYINTTVVVDCLKVKILFVCTAWFTESYKLASYLFAKDKLNAKMKSGFWSKRIYLKSLDNALLIINKSYN